MKKKLLIAALVSLAFVACSKDNTTSINEGGGIRFSASVTNPTRANQTQLSNLNSFNVTAVGDSQIYFTDLAVNSADNGVTWTTAQTYYWPSYQLAFYAFAPTSVEGVNFGFSGQSIDDFTPAVNVADQKDLVLAYAEGTKEANETSGVPLVFKHALSQVNIQAKCSNPNLKIEVLGVKVSHIPSAATFTFPAMTGATDDWVAQNLWVPGADFTEYMIKGESAVTLTAEAQSIMFGDDRFMLIPQQLIAWTESTANDGSYLSVLCRISSVNGDVTTVLYPDATDKYAFSAIPIDTNWMPGYRYTYTLEYGSNSGSGGGQIDPQPTNPLDPTDPDVDVTPKPGSEAGDQILSNPIKFTVTVDEWQDADGGEIQM